MMKTTFEVINSLNDFSNKFSLVRAGLRAQQGVDAIRNDLRLILTYLVGLHDDATAAAAHQLLLVLGQRHHDGLGTERGG